MKKVLNDKINESWNKFILVDDVRKPLFYAKRDYHFYHVPLYTITLSDIEIQIELKDISYLMMFKNKEKQRKTKNTLI